MSINEKRFILEELQLLLSKGELGGSQNTLPSRVTETIISKKDQLEINVREYYNSMIESNNKSKLRERIGKYIRSVKANKEEAEKTWLYEKDIGVTTVLRKWIEKYPW